MRIRWIGILVIAMAVLLSQGCDDGALLEIDNNYDAAIDEVYWSETYGLWGTNQLSGTIGIGSSMIFNVPEGTFYIRVVATDAYSVEDPSGFPTVNGSADYYYYNFN